MSLPVRLRTTASWMVVAVLLGGCAHDRPDRSDQPAAPVATTAHHSHRAYSDVNPPPRRAGDFVVKVLLLTREAPRGGRPGRQYWGEEVRTCVRATSDHGETVERTDWRARTVAGQVYPAARSGRRPAFPRHRVLAPGECETGWWLVTAPAGRRIDTIEFAPHGGPALLEWASMR